MGAVGGRAPADSCDGGRFSPDPREGSALVGGVAPKGGTDELPIVIAGTLIAIPMVEAAAKIDREAEGVSFPRKG